MSSPIKITFQYKTFTYIASLKTCAWILTNEFPSVLSSFLIVVKRFIYSKKKHILLIRHSEEFYYFWLFSEHSLSVEFCLPSKLNFSLLFSVSESWGWYTGLRGQLWAAELIQRVVRLIGLPFILMNDNELRIGKLFPLRPHPPSLASMLSGVMLIQARRKGLISLYLIPNNWTPFGEPMSDEIMCIKRALEMATPFHFSCRVSSNYFIRFISVSYRTL